jgi:hypothetical protein
VPDAAADAADIADDIDVMSHATDTVDDVPPWPDPDALTDVLPDTGPDTAEPDVPPVPDVPVIPDVPDVGDPDVGPPPELPYEDHCTAPGGGVNVYDLQDPACPDHPEIPDGKVIPVTVEGLIVTAVFGDQFFAQEPEGGPWSGIGIFALNAKAGDPFQDLVPGDRVKVEGSFREYFGLTQIYATKITKTGTGAPAAPDIVPYPVLIATGGSWAEPYEGVLVAVQNVGVINTKPDCPHDFGEFVVEGNLRVDDMAQLGYQAHLGDIHGTLAGVMNFTFGNFKLEPRTVADLDLVHSGGSGLSKCIKLDCIEAADAPELGNLVVTEIMADPFGEDGPREWFEVQNRSDAAILIAGLTVKDCALQSWTVPLQTAVALAPGGFATFGQTTDPAKTGGVDIDVAWGEGYYLPNGEGAILLYNDFGQLIDQARYASYDPWDFQQGVSLELVDPAADNTAPLNWKSSEAGKYGDGGRGTPGAPNSLWQ